MSNDHRDNDRTESVGGFGELPDRLPIERLGHDLAAIQCNQSSHPDSPSLCRTALSQ